MTVKVMKTQKTGTTTMVMFNSQGWQGAAVHCLMRGTFTVKVGEDQRSVRV